MAIQLPMQPSSQRMTVECTCDYKRLHVCASVHRLFLTPPNSVKGKILGSWNLPHWSASECTPSGTCKSNSPPLPTHQEVYKSVHVHRVLNVWCLYRGLIWKGLLSLSINRSSVIGIMRLIPFHWSELFHLCPTPKLHKNCISDCPI